MTAPRVDRLQASYFRKGKCATCGRQAERSRTFTGLTIVDCEQQANAWYATPLLHRRCEEVSS